MQPGEMIKLINQADIQGLTSLVETVNRIQESLAEGELFPITVLDRLGDIVRRRAPVRGIHASHVANYLEFHRGHVRRDLRLAERWRRSVLAVRDFCLEVMADSHARKHPLMHSRQVSSIARSLVDFHFRDDSLLSASANYLIDPPGYLIPWVEHIGDFMMSMSMMDYFHEAQFKALVAQATAIIRGYGGVAEAQQSLTKVAWAHLSRRKEVALEILQTAVNQFILVPELLNRSSLIRMHQIYFANDAEADPKFALYIDGVQTEMELTRDQRRQSEFDQKVERILIKLGIPFERQFPVAGFWVDFFVKVGNSWVVLECDDPLFHQVVHLQSGRRVPGGKDRTRDEVIRAKHSVIRLTTEEWDAAEDKELLILEKLST